MKKLKYITAVLLIAGCGGTSDAQTAFDEIMTALKSCDKNKIDEYYGFDELSAYVDQAAGEELKESIISTLSKMSYKVNSAEKSENGAVTLNVEITTVDFSAVMQDYITRVTTLVGSLEYKSKVQSMSDDEYRALMAEQMKNALENSGGKTASRTIDAKMVKDNDVWKLGGASDEFLGALFANMSEAVAALI